MTVLNPLGSRLDKVCLWSTTAPAAYTPAYRSYRLTALSRVLATTFLLRVSRLSTRRPFTSFLSDLMVALHGWGSTAKLSLFISVFDPQLFSLQSRPFLRYFLAALQGVSRRASLRFFSVRRLPVYSPTWSRLVFAVNAFARDALTATARRTGFWHRLAVVLTQPYVRFLAVTFNCASALFFLTVNRSSVTTNMLVRYLALSLSNGWSLGATISFFRRTIHKLRIPGLTGYKLSLGGRFTRKQIADYRWVREGILRFNAWQTGIDYAVDRGYTRHGAFGLKLWFGYSAT